jgi:hypothetical protein
MEGSRQERNVELARRGMEAYNRGDIDDVVYVYEIGDEGCVYLAIHPDRERALTDIRRRSA